MSAAFILIGSKIGDLFGRKRAYVLGLLGYAIGAAGHDARPGPDRHHHVLGDHRRAGGVAAAARHAVVDPRQLRGRGADARCTPWWARRPPSPPPSGPLLGGFITTYLSWRVAFLLEVVIIAIVLSSIGLVRTCPTPAPGPSTPSARSCRWSAWAASCSASWCGRRAARPSVRCCSSAWLRHGRAGPLARARQAAGPGRRCSTPTCSARWSSGWASPGRPLQQIALGGTMIALPIYFQMVLEYNAMRAGLSLAPLSLTMFGMALLAGRKAGGRRPEPHHPRRLRPAGGRPRGAAADHSPGRLGLVVRGAARDRGLRAWACWSRSSTTTRWPRCRRNGSARPQG